MSIESVFTKLQTQRRKQYEDIARRRSREAMVGTLANVSGTLIGTVINDNLKQSALNFINSAPVMDERIKFKVANANRDRIYKDQERIDASGGSGVDYYFNTYRDVFEDQAKDALAEREGEEGWRQIAANPDIYDSMINREMLSLARAMNEHHEEAYALAQKVGTAEEFDAVVELASKNAKPTSPMGWLSQTARGMISGRSREDFEAEAYESIVNGPLSQNAKALNDFMEQYNKNRNVIAAYNYTDFVNNLSAPEDRVKEDSETKIFTVGSGKYVSMFEQTTRTRTDRFTGETTTESDRPTQIWNSATDDPEIANQLIREAMVDNFNYADKAKTFFSGDGLTEYGTRVLAEFERVGDYTNPGQWEREGEIFTELLTNPQYVPNERIRTQMAAATEVVLTEALGLQALTTQLQKNEISEEEYKRRMKMTMDQLPFLFDLVEKSRYQSYEDLQ